MGKVSILVPTYNRPDMCRFALLSVLNQSYQNFQIIVTDDSDNDLTGNMIHELSDSRIFYYKNNENIGAAENMKLALEYADGEFINYLMDDDVFHPKKFERMLPLFRDDSVVMVTSIRREIDTNHMVGRVVQGLDCLFDASCVVNGVDLLNECLASFTNFIGEPTTAIFRRNSLSVPFGSFQGRQYECNVDMACWGELAKRGNIGFVHDCLSYLRVHPGQQSNNMKMRLNGLEDWAHQIMTGRMCGFLSDSADYRRALIKLIDCFSFCLKSNKNISDSVASSRTFSYVGDAIKQLAVF